MSGDFAELPRGLLYATKTEHHFPGPRTLLLKHEQTRESLGGIVKVQNAGPILRVSDSACLEEEWRICISTKFIGNVLPGTAL